MTVTSEQANALASRSDESLKTDREIYRAMSTRAGEDLKRAELEVTFYRELVQDADNAARLCIGELNRRYRALEHFERAKRNGTLRAGETLADFLNTERLS